MARCEECNTKLGLLRGYKHPIKGVKYPVCEHCFEVVNAEVLKTRDEVLNEMITINDVYPQYLPVMA